MPNRGRCEFAYLFVGLYVHNGRSDPGFSIVIRKVLHGGMTGYFLLRRSPQLVREVRGDYGFLHLAAASRLALLTVLGVIARFTARPECMAWRTLHGTSSLEIRLARLCRCCFPGQAAGLDFSGGSAGQGPDGLSLAAMRTRRSLPVMSVVDGRALVVYEGARALRRCSSPGRRNRVSSIATGTSSPAASTGRNTRRYMTRSSRSLRGKITYASLSAS